MSLLLPVEFCFSFSFLFLALIVHYRNPYSNFYKLSSLALALLFAAIFYEFMSVVALNYAEASVMSNLSNSFWLLSAALFLHSLLYYSDHSLLNQKSRLVLIYLPPLLVSSNLLTGYSLYATFLNTGGGLVPSPNYNYFLFLSTECIYLLLSAALCFSVWLKSSDLYKRKQAALLGLAFSLALAGTGFNYTALLSHRLFPPVNISAWMIAALPAIIAAARYQLFPRYPEMMEETILHFLPDSLLVTDLQGRISLANNAFYELAELDQNQAVHARTLSEVMLDKATANFLTHQIINQNRMIFDCPLALKNSILSLNAAQIRDHTGDKIGMVIIGRDVTERKKNESELKNITETLEKKLKEIDYLNRLFVEREIEMSQLKEEISALRKEPGHD